MGGAKWGVLISLQILIRVHVLGVPWIVDEMVSHTEFCATTDSCGGANSSSSAVLHVHVHAREGNGLPERSEKPIVFRHGDATSPQQHGPSADMVSAERSSSKINPPACSLRSLVGDSVASANHLPFARDSLPRHQHSRYFPPPSHQVAQNFLVKAKGFEFDSSLPV
jgi:hypothetical protein